MGDRAHTDRDSAPMTVAVETALGVVAYAVARGLPMGRITRSTGLTAADLSRPDGRLPAEAMGALWRVLDDAFPGEALALELARSAPLSAMGRVGQIARYAGSLRAALQVFVRYAHTMAPAIEVTLREDRDEATLAIHHPLDAVDRGHGAELGLGLGVRIVFENFGGGVVPERVEFVHAPHGPQALYEAHFRAPVLFGRPRNALVFSIDSLGATNTFQDPSVFRFLEAHLALASGQSPDDLDPLARARVALARNGQRLEYSAEALARALGLSLRQLQRLTQAQGTTVQELIDEARATRARELLRDAELGLGEIAFLLGYSNDRSFRRAFKRWTGQTPSYARELVSSSGSSGRSV